MNRPTIARRVSALALAAGAATATVVGVTAPAHASAPPQTVQVGPGTGITCITSYAQSYVRGSGFVTQGAGANFQLRYYGSQIAGSGMQVGSFAAETRPGFPNWRGPGYYEFCARNNGSQATVYLSLQTS